MVVLLALGSALAYGLSDFAGGVLSRRASPWSVAVAGQAAAAVLTLLVALTWWQDPTGADWAWGALSGVGGGVGAAFLYRGLGAGSMSVVAPVSAVGAAVLPVVVAVAVGERPSLLVWLGVACALPAIWLVSTVPADSDLDDGPRRSRAAELTDALLAGAGFGLLFVSLGQVPDTAGLGPLAVSYAVSVPATALLAVALGASWVPNAWTWRRAWIIGLLGTAATALFLLSTHHGLLTVAAVIASLYPASTVLLAAVVLRERVGGVQGIGLGLAAVAVGLVAAG